MAITIPQQTEILKVVAGLFNAAPGGSNLTELAKLVEGGASISQLADALAANTLFTNGILAGKVTVDDQVEVLMNNFGVTADGDPTSAGSQAKAYFTEQLNNDVGFGQIVYNAVTFLTNTTDIKFATAQTLLNNKALVAAAYSKTGSSTDLSVLQNVLSNVKGDAPYTGADVENILITVGAGPVGKTFALTANVDSGSAFTGGSGNDTFNGAKGTIDGDVLAGGSGSDTLNLTVDNADDNKAAFTATGIENLSIRTTAPGAVSLDLGSVTGVETLTANRLLNKLTLTDVQDIAAIAIDRNASSANLTVTYAVDVVAGTADSVTVTVTNSSNVGTVTLHGIETVNLVSTDNPTDDTNEIQIDAAGSGTATEVINVSGAGDLTLVATDALTINNSASGDVTLTATAATTVNYTGSGDLDVTVGNALNVTISAATATGALNVTANGAGDLSITGSAQADTIDMLDTLTNDDSIAGGDGADTLKILGDGVTSVADGDVTVTGVETLEIVSDTAGDNLDFDVFSAPASFTTVVVTADADADAVTLTDVQAATYTIRNAATSNTADDLSAVTIDLKDSSGTADAVTVNLQNRQKGDVVANQEAFALGTLTVAGVETLNINATKVSSAGTAEDITVSTLTAAAAKTVNLTGDADLTISNAFATTVTTVAAGSYTGALDITMGASAATVTAGSGDDTIRFGSTLGSTDSVDGGNGDDTVVATLSSGTVSPTLTNVETLSVTFAGGALTGANLGAATTTLNVVDASAAGNASNLKATVTTINQQGGSASATAMTFSYATGADATVSYGVADATENVANAATTFTNVKTLTVAGGDGTTTDRTLALGSLTGAALTSLTVTSGDDTGDTVNTGAVTAAALQTLTVTADEANVTLGTVGAAALTTLSLSSTGAGDLAVGAVTAGSKVTSVSISSTVDGVVDQDDITATDSDITNFTINLAGTYGASDLDRVVADNITTLSITTTSAGTSLDIEDFVIDESIGSITFNTGDDFTGGNAFIDTGATGTVGDITITASDTFTVAADDVFINDAVTVGNISITASGNGNGVNLGRIDEATTVGNITIVANDDVEFDGADAATSVGNINVTVAAGKTVDMNDHATGTTGGTIGTVTASGAGNFTLQIGAVTSMGTIDLSGLDGDSDIALSDTTTIGVTYTGGDGADTFVATGGSDVITAGLGADIITGGVGADTIDLTESTSAADDVQYAALADGSAAGVAAGTFSGHDTISGFTASTDDINFSTAAFLAGTNDTGNTINTGTGGVIGTTTNLAFTLATDNTDELNVFTAATDASLTDVDYVVNALNAMIAGGSFTSDTGDTAFIVFAGTSSSAIYYFTEDDGTDTTFNAGDLQLIGVVDAVLTTADIGVY